MAAEVALALLLLSLLGLCVAVLVWDIKRRRIGKDEDAQAIQDLQLRIGELEEENHRLRQVIEFMEKMSAGSPTPSEK